MAMPMALIVKTALSEQIIDVLRARIIAGDLASDAPIRQDALAAELGISKIPLREALVRLEQDGLVASERNRGYVVRPLTAEEAYDVFDLRLKIEPDAVAAAAACLGPADVAAGRDALGALDAAAAARDGRAGALNRAFHMALIRPGGRPVTLQMAERLHTISERYVVRHPRARRPRRPRAPTNMPPSSPPGRPATSRRPGRSAPPISRRPCRTSGRSWSAPAPRPDALRAADQAWGSSLSSVAAGTPARLLDRR